MKRFFLGVSDTRFDSGIALCDGESVLFAANEERYTRRKNEGGIPRHCFDSAARLPGIPADASVDLCVAGIMNPPMAVRLFPFLQKLIFRALRSPQSFPLTARLLDWAVFHTPVVSASPNSFSGGFTQRILKHYFKRRFMGRWPIRSVRFIDHHQAHAASAFALAGFESALVVTCDGMGDGVSLTVSQGTGAGLRRLWALPASISYGTFYENVTEAMGFVPNRDEGKVTGLAAFGKADRVAAAFPFRRQADGRVTFHGTYGRRGVSWIQRELLSRFGREDVAAWAQENLEKHLSAIVRDWSHRTGMRRVALAGGVFANVKLNQRIREAVPLDGFFVCPNMGDGGLSFGAAAACGGVAGRSAADVFFGDGFSQEETETALREFPVKAEISPDPEKEAARLLADGALVARFRGRMEWGPRALGNRSVLAQPDERKVAARLNTCLRRSDFMPFAPAVLDEDASEYLVDLAGARHAAEFMTLCFPVTSKMERENPAAVHIDGTARPQLVRADHNPTFHRLLTEYKRLTGRAVLLNTSFNMHEEPIVRTPREALSAFLRSGLDYLVLENFIVEPSRRANAADRIEQAKNLDFSGRL
jgi:carbamoyltransferase